ncbi:hypothetical protein FB45DRAFT_1014233 [Roridomyces roridus]|uniref:Uncharacterized protein n=1 Tax=Roridomyces roridus TaxID=1738132 RepID=A0AAD7AXP0_9AGAR|nr:hypothetical protein FB45DRAFT_1014233 [Roridomyces roridus]
MISDSNTTQVFEPLHNLSPTDSSRGQLGSPPLSNDFMQLGFPRLDDYGDECPPRESTRTWVLRLPQRAKNESLNGTEGYCLLVPEVQRRLGFDPRTDWVYTLAVSEHDNDAVDDENLDAGTVMPYHGAGLLAPRHIFLLVPALFSLAVVPLLCRLLHQGLLSRHFIFQHHQEIAQGFSSFLAHNPIEGGVQTCQELLDAVIVKEAARGRHPTLHPVEQATPDLLQLPNYPWLQLLWCWFFETLAALAARFVIVSVEVPVSNRATSRLWYQPLPPAEEGNSDEEEEEEGEDEDEDDHMDVDEEPTGERTGLKIRLMFPARIINGDLMADDVVDDELSFEDEELLELEEEFAGDDDGECED